MGWSIGYDSTWERDIGYGVPAFCDHPDCDAEIDRGLAYVCGGQPYGGDEGCGLYFCGKHLSYAGRPSGEQVCERCANPDGEGNVRPFDAKPEHPRWIRHVLTDESWSVWRSENPRKVAAFKEQLARPYPSIIRSEHVSETIELRCEGGSDDTFGVYGAGPDEDFDNCASGKPIVFHVSHGDESMYVVGQYAPGPCAGWLIGIAPAEDDVNIPSWPMHFEWSDRPYSPQLKITAPKGVKVKHVKKGA